MCACVKISRWERRIIDIQRRTLLKVITLAELVGYWNKTQFKTSPSPPKKKSAYFTHLDFSAAKIEK
jgi:hypothetical protein